MSFTLAVPSGRFRIMSAITVSSDSAAGDVNVKHPASRRLLSLPKAASPRRRGAGSVRGRVLTERPGGRAEEVEGNLVTAPP